MKRLFYVLMVFTLAFSVLAVNSHLEKTTPWNYNDESTPVWKLLENLNQYEKENAIIEIEPDFELTEKLIDIVNLIEEEWNDGNYTYALDLLREEPVLSSVAIGIQWREPITSFEEWGNDIRIGTRDNISVVALDVDNATGNLLVALHHEISGSYYWSVNISYDSGATWSETYNWSSTSSPMDIDGSIFDNYFYVSYTVPSSNVGRVRRFSTSNGIVDASYSWVNVIDEGVALRDIALATNQDFNNNRIVYWAIMDNDSLRMYFDTEAGPTWQESSPPIGNADRGLDACWNAELAGHYAWASYVGTDDSLYAETRFPWTNYGPFDYVGTATNTKTSIAAYNDTIMITYPNYVSPHYRFKYRVSYTEGNTWTYGTLASPSENIGLMNDITGRNGDGFGVVYQNEGGAAEGYYRHRGYSPSPPWSSPVSFTDSVARYNVKPSIERIASGIYGIIYVNYPEQIVLFDRSDWTGISEEDIPEDNIVKLYRNYPDPFTDKTVIKFFLPDARKVSLNIYDVSGKLIRNLVDGNRNAGLHSITWYGKADNRIKVPSGVYFYMLNTGDYRESGKMTLIK